MKQGCAVSHHQPGGLRFERGECDGVKRFPCALFQKRTCSNGYSLMLFLQASQTKKNKKNTILFRPVLHIRALKDTVE